MSEKIEELKQLPGTSRDSGQILELKKIEKEFIENERKCKATKTNIVWPKTTSNAPQRTREELFEIIEQIENGQDLSIDQAKGVTGRSVFFDIPYFNMVRDIPVDYLHCCCLGVVKRCVEMTFRVGDIRPRITKRSLSSPAQFNALVKNVKFPKECNRRVRDLDLSVYKGQEFRNLLLFLFPFILKCIQVNAKERHMWLYLTYMIKACVIPSEEFRNVPLDVIEHCCKKFYSIYQSLFGERNCTYNTHVLGCHLLEMRYHGPLTMTSAYPFESFYGELRNSFVPGTTSTLKQILSNVLLKQSIANHKCQLSIHLSEKDTALECNSLIYCFSNQKYKFYKIKTILDDTIVCNVQNKVECSFVETIH